jgi:parvulin-like peptidyl-prolyl isomerase
LRRFHPTDFNPEFRKQVKALRVGDLSPVFRSPVGFHLVLLIEKYDGKFDSYKLQVMQNLVAQKTVETGAALRKLLKSLAAKYPEKYLDPSYRDSSQAGIYN